MKPQAFTGSQKKSAVTLSHGEVGLVMHGDNTLPLYTDLNSYQLLEGEKRDTSSKVTQYNEGSLCMEAVWIPADSRFIINARQVRR